MQMDSIAMNRRNFLKGFAVIVSAAALPLAPMQAIYDNDAPLFASLSVDVHDPAFLTLWFDGALLPLISANLDYVYEDIAWIPFTHAEVSPYMPRLKYCNLIFETAITENDYLFCQPKEIKLSLPGAPTYRLTNAFLTSSNASMYASGKMIFNGEIVFSSVEEIAQ